MRNIALTMTVALGTICAFAQEEQAATPAADNAATPATTAEKPADCTAKSDNQADDDYWVDIETITVEAENGDPIAQYIIAYVTETGANDTPKDPDKAHKMYSTALPGLQKAADEGNAYACRALAYMYAEGKGVEKDMAKAKKYWDMFRDCCRKACEGSKDCEKACDKPCDQSACPAPAAQPETK